MCRGCDQAERVIAIATVDELDVIRQLRHRGVVGTDRGGIPELVAHEERGLIYPARCSDSLASALQGLWDDDSRVRRMGLAAKAFADDEFNDKRFYGRLVEIYTRVMA